MATAMSLRKEDVKDGLDQARLTEAAARVRAQSGLGRSDRLDKLFDYILQRTLLGEAPKEIELSRASEEEKTSQLQRLDDFQARHSTESAEALRRLRDASTAGDNVFAELMNAARVCSLGQLTDAFFEVGGQYRRSM